MNLLIPVLVQIITRITTRKRIPYHTSLLTGKLYYEELMQTANEQRFIDCTRMRRDTFLILLAILQQKNTIKASKIIEIGEKLMIMLYILQGYTIRNAAERFQHSISTVSIVFKETLFATTELFPILNQQFPEENNCPAYIRENYRFFPYFRNYIGALDGTHVSASISSEQVRPFRDRKGQVSQNVLGVVDFRMIFTFVLAGWEGSAHDGRVLADGIQRGLSIPEGK